MIQRLSVFLLIMLFISCKQKLLPREQLVFDRIEFVFNLKKEADESVWKSFNNIHYDVPLIYFTDSSSYAANPTAKFLAAFPSVLVYETPNLKIYKTSARIDKEPFHMETGMTLGTPTSEYNYHSPFMKCSSFEEAKKIIPVLLSTEEWATMILHEYFHGFQYKHPSYLNYIENTIAAVDRDSLQSFYQNNNWFKESIDKENDLLLQAIAAPGVQQTNAFIDSFFILRNQRRITAKEKLSLETEKYEKAYETMEGTARYIEYSLYNVFKTIHPDEKLIKSDTSFKLFKNYKNYQLQDHEWLYKTARSAQYFYAVGFNMARLLDKLNIDYKSKLFNQGSISLEALLRPRQT